MVVALNSNDTRMVATGSFSRRVSRVSILGLPSREGCSPKGLLPADAEGQCWNLDAYACCSVDRFAFLPRSLVTTGNHEPRRAHGAPILLVGYLGATASRTTAAVLFNQSL